MVHNNNLPELHENDASRKVVMNTPITLQWWHIRNNWHHTSCRTFQHSCLPIKPTEQTRHHATHFCMQHWRLPTKLMIFGPQTRPRLMQLAAVPLCDVLGYETVKYLYSPQTQSLNLKSKSGYLLVTMYVNTDSFFHLFYLRIKNKNNELSLSLNTHFLLSSHERYKTYSIIYYSFHVQLEKIQGCYMQQCCITTNILKKPTASIQLMPSSH